MAYDISCETFDAVVPTREWPTDRRSSEGQVVLHLVLYVVVFGRTDRNRAVG